MHELTRMRIYDDWSVYAQNKLLFKLYIYIGL